MRLKNAIQAERRRRLKARIKQASANLSRDKKPASSKALLGAGGAGVAAGLAGAGTLAALKARPGGLDKKMSFGEMYGMADGAISGGIYGRLGASAIANKFIASPGKSAKTKLLGLLGGAVTGYGVSDWMYGLKW